MLIDIPKDIQLAKCEYTKETYPRKETPKAPSEPMLKEAAELIAASKRPFIYAGGGVIATNASKDLLEFAEKLGAPIGTSMMGLSAVPRSHPLMLGMSGMHGNFASTKAMGRSDLIIGIGARFSDRATGKKSEFSKNRKVLHIDIDPAEIGKNIPAYVAMLADVKEALQALNKLPLHKSDPEWLKEVNDYKHSADNRSVMNNDVLNPYLVMQGVAKRVPDDTCIATDVGQHQMWTTQFYPFQKPRTLITSGGLGHDGLWHGRGYRRVHRHREENCFGHQRRKLPYEYERIGDSRFQPPAPDRACAQQFGAGHGAAVADDVL